MTDLRGAGLGTGDKRDLDASGEEDVVRLLTEERNWGRWGPDDQRGLLNLVSDETRSRAAQLVRTGRAISLSRKFPKIPGEGNPRPAQHYMRTNSRGTAGTAVDFIGMDYHGLPTTHLDGLGHVWDADGMWNGKDPKEVLTFDGVASGGIENWREGIFVRGVLLDVPKFRGEPFVTQDKPVHGSELAAICENIGLDIQPGDAVIVRSGRDSYEERYGPWGTGEASLRSSHEAGERPGLHNSCLEFLRRTDAAVLVWDMMDLLPRSHKVPLAVHGAISAFGLALVDNADLSELASACNDEGRSEFLLIVAPLRIEGGTGSPVNPLAVL
jgi:kynurenine formamidase